MADRRAFPFVDVRNIAVGEGVSKTGVMPEIIERGDEAIDEFIERVTGDREDIIYTLEIRALSARSAAAKGRIFVRTKNLFEPDTIDLIQVMDSNGEVVLGGTPYSIRGTDKYGMDEYTVMLSVGK